MKKMILITGLVLVSALSTTAVIATAEETPNSTATTTLTPNEAVAPQEFPAQVNKVCTVISNSRAQLTRTREQWENECYSNPFTDEEMAHEPNAADLTRPSNDASPQEWSDWYGARVESCKVLTKDAEYIECMYRPWIYGF